MLAGFPPQSSCIPFSYWKETVSVLLGSDRTSLCAIASYIDEPFMDLDRDLLEDWPPVCTLCAGVGQGRGSLGVWTPKAGDDSTELSHPGALSPHSGCKDSTCLLSLCFAWRPSSQMWGDVILCGCHLLTEFNVLFIKERGWNLYGHPRSSTLFTRQLRDPAKNDT